MEGRFPTGIYVVFANYKDSAEEHQVNDWYNNVHIPDVTGLGLFTNATRYMNSNAKGTAEDPKYLAVYETELDDPAAAWTKNIASASEWRDGGGIRSALTVTMRALFLRMDSSPKPPQGKRTAGLLVSMKDCKDPAKEAEFNKWHDEVHTPEVLGAGAYWGGMRFVNPDNEHGLPRYLNIYESELDALSAQRVLAKRPNPDPTGGLGDYGVRRFAGAFDLLYSQAGATPRAEASKA